MSGSDTEPGQFTLTATKCQQWHWPKQRQGCKCGATLRGVFHRHLEPAGFECLAVFRQWMVLRGPGLTEGNTRYLYEALSGKRGSDTAIPQHYYENNAARVVLMAKRQNRQIGQFVRHGNVAALRKLGLLEWEIEKRLGGR